jgi:putative Mn2+ efflux pump MntP
LTNVEIVLVALGLAMDAFAASITCGLSIHKLQIQSGSHSRQSEFRQWLLVALCFGFFQAAMPIIGWTTGSMAKGWIEPVDHWVAFVLLSLVGGHMLLESRGSDSDENEEEKQIKPITVRFIIFLGITTSIDALAVGVSLVALRINIWQPALIIGIITAVLSLAGAWIGDKMGHFFEKKLEFIGGVILIGIGLKILLSHIM